MISMRDRFYDTTAELLAGDERVSLVLADIGAGRIPQSERVINVGIREQLLIGVAGGLAMEGYRPIAHSYAPFLVERPFEQIKLDLGHQGVGAILVSVGASYDASASGRTHQAPEDVALMATLPGWRIHVPGHPDEAEAFLRRAAASDDLVYIRLAEQTNSRPHADGSDAMVVVRTGRKAAVIGVGSMLDPVLEATADLDVTVLYAATVRPFDRDTLRSTMNRDIVLVEPYLEGTSAGEVSVALRDIPHRLLAIGYRNEESRKYGTPHDHLRHHDLHPSTLTARIEGFLGLPRFCR